MNAADRFRRGSLRSWLSRLSATGRPASRASRRTLCLSSPPSGKEAPRLAPETREHVALVLAGVGGLADERPSPSGRCACSGRWRAAAPSESARSSIASKRTKPLQRTHGLGVRPAEVAVEVVHHLVAEAVADVEGEVGDAHALGQGSRPDHGLRRAAALAPRQWPGRTTARGSRRPPRPPRRARAAPPRRCPRRRSSPRACAAGTRGCSALRRARPIRAHGGRRPPPDPPRVAWPATNRRALRTRPRRPGARPRAPGACTSSTALPAAWTEPQPDASKPASPTSSPSTRSEIRIRSPQAAPPDAPACGASVRAPRPRGPPGGRAMLT